jgi:hypothetical protein
MQGLAITLVLLSAFGWWVGVAGLGGAFLNCLRKTSLAHPFAWDRLTATGRQWLILFYLACVISVVLFLIGFTMLTTAR